MASAFLCAFILPPAITDSARLHAAGIFNPISYPIRRIAEGIYQPPEHFVPADPRTTTAIAAENDQLRQQLADLHSIVDRLKTLQADRQKLGDLQSLCVPIAVAGTDTAGRDALLLNISPTTRLPKSAPVLYSGGLAGKLETGIAGARVRLITDEGFAVSATLIRFPGGGAAPVRLTGPRVIVGTGQGGLTISGMQKEDYQTIGLREGDWAVLDDPDPFWKDLQGRRLGRIVSAKVSHRKPLYMDLTLAPEIDLKRLADVMVYIGETK